MRGLLRSIDAERPVLIAGPTASGKSALALEIAAARGGVIVNADALQIYSCWRVLTARPSAADEAAVPHRLYGHVPGDAAYSVGAWLRDAAPLLAGTRPILVGGTVLYFARLTAGLADIPPEEYPAEQEWRGGTGPRREYLLYPFVHSLLVTTGSCSARSWSRSRLPMCSDSGACTHL